MNKNEPTTQQLLHSWRAAFLSLITAHAVILGPLLIATVLLSDSTISIEPLTLPGYVFGLFYGLPVLLAFAVVVILAVGLWGAMIPVSAAVLRKTSPRILSAQPSRRRCLAAATAGMGLTLVTQLMASVFAYDSEGFEWWLVPLVIGITIGSLAAAMIIARSTTQASATAS